MVQYVDEQYIMNLLEKGSHGWRFTGSVVKIVKIVIDGISQMQKTLSNSDKSEFEHEIERRIKFGKMLKKVMWFGLLGIIGIMLIGLFVFRSPSIGGFGFVFGTLWGFGLMIVLGLNTKKEFHMRITRDTSLLEEHLKKVCYYLKIDYDAQGPYSVRSYGHTTVLGWGSWSAFGAGVLLSSFSKGRADAKNMAAQWGEFCFRYNQIAAEFNNPHRHATTIMPNPIMEICKKYKGHGYFVGYIPHDVLREIYVNLSIPKYDEIVAFLSSKMNDSAEEGIAICKSGIFWNLKYGEPQENSLSWDELMRSSLETKGVFAGLQIGENIVDLSGCGIGKKEFTSLLSEIKTQYSQNPDLFEFTPDYKANFIPE